MADNENGTAAKRARTESLSSKMECPVCCETFRSPKSLICGHSICADCCKGLAPPPAKSILCPVCRRSTNIPAGGLPTNYVLQDLVQELEADDDSRDHHQCVECKRQCTSDEVWVLDTQSNGDMLPRCYRCVILKNSNMELTALPPALESVADMFKRYEGYHAVMTCILETSATEQREWNADIQRTAGNIIQAIKATREAAEHMNKEFQALEAKSQSVKVPDRLEDLQQFNQSIQCMKSALDRISNARRVSIDRTKSVLNSLTTGLQCLWNATEEHVEGDLDREDEGAAALKALESLRNMENGLAASIEPASSSTGRTTPPNTHHRGSVLPSPARGRYRMSLISRRRGDVHNRPLAD